MSTFNIKQGDTFPSLRANLKDGSNEAIDLTGATVRFHMRPVGTAVAAIDAAATVISAGTGVVDYTWQAGDTATVGEYQAEFEVTYPGGEVETFPNGGFLSVKVTDDIA